MQKGVVWVSTVLYIVITISLISLTLVAVTPMIERYRDRIVIEQSVQMLEKIDEMIEKISLSEGSRAKVEIVMRKGIILINSSRDSVSWQLDGCAFMYSEPDHKIVRGKKTILTSSSKTTPNKWFVSIEFNYSDYNITFENEEVQKLITPSEMSYNLFIENKGKKQIDFKLL
ncbi:MAG: hypothetical protein NZ889_01040 [Candidatus Pacearchaeota archaeon]|nr:hypothetical protein [Candidatus Pacearchaeota archaeon]